MKKGLAKMTALGLCASMVLSMAGCSGGGGSASTEKAAGETAGGPHGRCRTERREARNPLN